MKTTLISIAIVISVFSFSGCESIWPYDPKDPACPVVESISPTGAKFGEVVTVTGKNFIKDNPQFHNIYIGESLLDKQYIIEVPSAEVLKFRVPENSKSGNVVVKLDENVFLCNETTSDTGRLFTYLYTAISVETFAGTWRDSSCQNCFFLPAGLDIDALGNLWVADNLNHVVRKITKAGIFEKRIGRFKQPGCDNVFYSNTEAAPLKGPVDLVVDNAGDVYVTEKSNGIIRKINALGNGVSLFSGECLDFSIVQGSCNEAKYGGPVSIANDGENLFIIDANSIRKITNLPCQVTSFISQGSVFTSAAAIEINRIRPHSGPIFVSDVGSGKIKSINASGVATDLFTTITFNNPIALESDDNGNLFVADKALHKIFTVSPSGEVRVLAGSGTPGYSDGTASNSQFNAPSGLAFDLDSKILYVSDSKNHLIRKISLK